jgi:hypothetical protein
MAARTVAQTYADAKNKDQEPQPIDFYDDHLGAMLKRFTKGIYFSSPSFPSASFT